MATAAAQSVVENMSIQTSADLQVVEIPFSLVSNLIVVKANVDGQEQAFLFDSGAQYSILNSKYCNADSSQSDDKASALGVNGEQVDGISFQKHTLDFYGITMAGRGIPTFDLSHLEVIGQPVYGLIGYDIIKDYDVLFDYADSTITLIKTAYFDTYRQQHLSGARASQPFL